ncbi:ABC transporter ATP-binding protein [Patescibacteria group bacterium]
MPKKAKKYKIIEMIQFLWSYVRNYKGLFFIVLGLSAITSFVNSITPFIFGQIIDNFLGKPLFLGLTLVSILVVWSLLMVSRIFLRKIILRAGVNLEVKIERDLIKDLINKILFLPINYHYEEKPGQIYKKVDRAAAAVNNIFDSFMFSFSDNILNMSIAFIFMLTINWQLALLNLIIILVFFIFAAIYKMNEILSIRKKVNTKYNTIYGNIGDIIANIFSVKVNTAEQKEQKKLKTDFKQTIGLVDKSIRLWTDVIMGQSFISTFGTISIVLYGSYLLNTGSLSPGEFATFLLYIGMIYGPIWWMSNQYRQVKRWMVDLNDAHIILKEKVEKVSNKETKDFVLSGNIEFRNVSFKYPLRNEGVLKNMSFKIKPGQTIAIFGETGSGKTTIYNLLLRLFEQSKGEIFFDQVNVKEINRQTLRGQIGIVPQDPALFNESVLYNIKYGHPTASIPEVIRAAKIANAHDFIKALPKGYQTKVGERGVKLSGGQVQRIAIARAALRDPKILILDEATTSLDQKTKFEVLDALDKVIENRTTIIITHDFSAITQNADHIIVLKDGKIIQQGKHSSLVKQKGVYYDLWITQQKHLETK